MTSVRTVLGDLPGHELGVTDAHDHLFLATRKLPNQELDDPAAAETELRAWSALGGRSVIQWSPYGTNRRPADLAALSRATGVHLVAATGLHHHTNYAPDLVDRVRPHLADLFVTELTNGLRDDTDPDRPAPETPAGSGPVRAGVIKVATDFHGISGQTRDTMTAAAEAHHATGAPICIHHEMGTAALDTLDLLCGQHDVPPDRVVLGHLNRFPDPLLHRQLAASGAFLAFDGPSRAHHPTDWRLIPSLVELATAGHLHQLLLGGDTTTANARSTAEGPGMPYLLRVLRPRLTRELGEAAVTALFVDNPARAFAADWR